jgi:hypothetical protein
MWDGRSYILECHVVWALIDSRFFLGLNFNPEDGGSTVLRNLGKLVPHYTATHPQKTVPSSAVLELRVCKLTGRSLADVGGAEVRAGLADIDNR